MQSRDARAHKGHMWDGGAESRPQSRRTRRHGGQSMPICFRPCNWDFDAHAVIPPKFFVQKVCGTQRRKRDQDTARRAPVIPPDFLHKKFGSPMIVICRPQREKAAPRTRNSAGCFSRGASRACAARHAQLATRCNLVSFLKEAKWRIEARHQQFQVFTFCCLLHLPARSQTFVCFFQPLVFLI